MKQNSPLPNDNLTEIRELFEATKQGGKDAPVAFQKLFQYLLSQTILAGGQSVRLYRLGSHSFVLSGYPHPKAESNASSDDIFRTFKALELKNKHYLYLYIRAYLDKDDRNFIKVRDSRYYYQLDTDGRQLVFRFDYERFGPEIHPPGHVHIYGKHWQAENNLPQMSKVHFPAGRPTLESIIRLLINDFGIKPNTADDVWRPILKYSEDEFLKMARSHRGQATDDN
jgi:hypothetical protein